MGLDRLDKETRTALIECCEEAIGSNERLSRALDWFAEDEDKNIPKLYDQTRDIAEAVEELETKIEQQESTFRGAIQRVTRSMRGMHGRYRGIFPDEGDARAFGLLVMGTMGREDARDALKSERRDIYDQFERALSGNVADEGGALLPPTEMLNVILWLKERYGVIASKVGEVPIGAAGETTWVKDKGEPFMNVRGELEQAITENSLELERASLKPREFYSLYFYPEKLEADSATPLGELIARRFAWAFAYHLDNDGFNGDASATYHGIYGIIPKLKAVSGGAAGIVTASGTTAFSAVTDTHVLTTQSILPQYADATNQGDGTGNAEGYCHRRFFFEAIVRLARATGGFTAEEFAGRRRLAFNGSPINIAQVMPKTGGDQVIPWIYGDLDLACMRGVKRSMRVRRNENVRWLQGQIAVMADLVQDFVVQNIGDSTDVEAITALKLAA